MKIKGIENGQFGKPVLVLNDGTSLTLNQTNTQTLIRPYGPESRDWIDREIELYSARSATRARPRQHPGQADLAAYPA